MSDSVAKARVKVVVVVRPSPQPAPAEASSPSEITEPASEAPPPPRPRRSWRFRFGVTLLVLAALPLILRLCLPWIVPGVLAEIGSMLGLQVRYDSLSVSVLEGSYHARGVVIRPLEGGDPLITVDSVQAEIDYGVLLREGRMRYRQFLVDGLRGEIETLPDGRLAWEERIERHLYPQGRPADHEGDDDFFFYELFRASASRIHWLDRSVEPPVDAWLDIDLLAHDWNCIRDPYWPDRLQLTLGTETRPRAAKITSRFVDGETRIDLEIKGLLAASAAPYLHDAGISTDAEQIDLALGWTTRAPVGGGPRWIEFMDGQLALDGREVLALERARLDPLYQERDANLGEVRLAGLRLEVVRLADGGWSVGGFRSRERSKEDGGSRLYGLKGLHIQASRLSYHDRSANPPIHTALAVRELRTGAFGESGSGEPVRFTADLFAPHLAGGVAVVGTFAPTSARSELAARVEMRQVSGRALDPYLERMGLRPVLDDASIRFDLETSTAPIDSHAWSSRSVVRGLEIEQGGAQLLRFDELKVLGRRLDTTSEDYAFDGITLRGVEGLGRFRVDGATEFGGFEVVDAPAAPPNAKASRWVVDELALQLRRVEWQNQALSGTAPLVLRDMRLVTRAPLVIEGRHRESSPPIDVELTGEVAPVASHCRILAQLRPFAAEPRHAFEATVSGLRAQGILATRPWMRDRWAAGNLREGVLRANGQITEHPAGPGHPEGGFEVDLDEVVLDATPAGPTLGRLDQARLFVERFDPASGDLVASRLELTHPYLLVRRTDEGLEVFGLKRLPTVEEPQGVYGPPPPPTGRGVFGPEQRIQELLLSGGEVLYRDERARPWAEIPVKQIDLKVHGLTSRGFFEARPLVFSGTATAGLVDLPWRNPVSGVKRSKVLSFLTFGKIVRPVEEREDLDRRFAFGSLEVDGRLTLAPSLRGTASVNLKEFELPIFRGLARKEELDISHGRLGISSRIEFRGADPILVKSSLEFNRLRLSDEGGFGRKLGLPGPTDVVVAALEDADGVITIPLDIEVDAGTGLVSRQTKQLVMSGIGSAVTRALAKSPLTLGSAIKGLGKKAIYLLPKSVRKRLEGEELPPLGPVSLSFAPGGVYLSPREVARLENLMAYVRKGVNLQFTLEHTLGAEDVALAEGRANPSEDTLQGILRRLRVRQREILERQRPLRARAEAASSSGDAEELAAVSASLRQLDQAYGELERSRDAVYGLLSERSSWDVRRRCREAALGLGQSRLEATKRALLSFGQANVAGRVVIRPPVFNEGSAQGSVTVIPKAIER